MSRVRDLTIAVIPCLDEAGRVGAVVRGVTGTVSRILVVDDGSSDGTAAEAESAGATVLRHSKPLGKGAALAAALGPAPAADGRPDYSRSERGNGRDGGGRRERRVGGGRVDDSGGDGAAPRN